MIIKSIETLYEVIQPEIFSNGGRGFTVQLAPEITKYEEYQPWEKFLTYKSYWKLCYSFTGDCWKPGRNGSLGVSIHWWYYLTKELEDALPRGILIQRTPVEVLLDQRTEITRSTYMNANYVEGRRVSLTVSDEYAARVFKEKYIDIGLPFRDHLLTIHAHILNTIVSKYLYSNILSITITRSGINLTSDEDELDQGIQFKNLGMKNLSSSGQVYGMVLALIETIKKARKIDSDDIFRIEHKNIYCFGLYIENIEKPTQSPKKLEEW